MAGRNYSAPPAHVPSLLLDRRDFTASDTAGNARTTATWLCFVLITTPTLMLGSEENKSAPLAGCIFLGGRDEGQPLVLPDSCPDLLKVGELEQVRKIASLLGIESQQVKFNGCDGIPFATEARGTPPWQMYMIFYPASSTDAGSILGPIAHELGHVYQLESEGAALREKRASMQIELGADFLAGVSVASATETSSVSTATFLHSLAVIGRYNEREADPQAHGSPNQRAQAFRNGYYMNLLEFDNEVDSAYLEFNANRLRGIQNNR